ncbi:Neuroendocrine convertase 1 [Nymphon striatum]|nr:Neuroendocrine convertase 1 [Nymphon striatum]
MLLANLRIVLLLLYVIDVEGVWIHKPGNLFIIKENGHKYTLAWLVTLNKHIKDEKSATSIANSVGLLNLGQKKKYMNVSNVWENGLTGKGVTVCVIDDGIEWKNTDLVNSYNPKASYDVISNDNDPTPDYNN